MFIGNNPSRIIVKFNLFNLYKPYKVIVESSINI